jgi:hypothetical protein
MVLVVLKSNIGDGQVYQALSIGLKTLPWTTRLKAAIVKARPRK